MNRTTVKAIREAVIEALKPVETEFNVVLEHGGGSFTDTDFNMKLSFRDDSAPDKMVRDYQMYQIPMNLKPLGSEIPVRSRNGTELMKIVGYAPRNRKYPIIVENLRGQKYKLPLSKAEV